MNWPDDYINKVICGDADDVMYGIPDDAIDVIITDPPYGVRKKEEWDDPTLVKDQLSLWFNRFDTLSNGLIWFCAGKMIPTILENSSLDFFRLLVWNKPPGSQFAGASHNNLWYSIEPILLFGKPEFWNTGIRKERTRKWISRSLTLTESLNQSTAIRRRNRLT